MTDKKQEVRNETVCTKTTRQQQKALQRLARQRKQTVSKTLNDLLTNGLTQAEQGKLKDRGGVECSK